MSRSHNPESPAIGDEDLAEAAEFYRREITDRLSMYTAEDHPPESYPDALWNEIETDYQEVMGRHPRGSDRAGYVIANEFLRAQGDEAVEYFNELDKWSHNAAVPATLDGLSEKNLPVYPESADDDSEYDTVSVEYDDYEDILHAYAMKSVINARQEGELLDAEAFDKKPVVMDEQ